MTSNNEKIQSLHKLYSELSRTKLKLDMARYQTWERFIAHGYGENELRIVLKYLNKGIQNRDRRDGCLKFGNLFLDMNQFEEELAMANREFRPKPAYESGKRTVLRATGRPDEPPAKESESIAVILERTKLAAMLHEWRMSNPL